ncbi:hypothetical protein QYE77_05385 [Thermanaerothrix sp. 4228-RoL]|uniref:Uncharacterized protein n=1 Tax=Thermanaerothrix solaris TaxID=3058434 RepID=A0ABU3NNY7_9CHLR|nr:hypothetical protein [Thermanaerothrix sp. 4228-RoL]MDT8897692.1 hypothetical protein [Thermanaerothrix sp. 4228-RoL]
MNDEKSVGLLTSDLSGLSPFTQEAGHRVTAVCRFVTLRFQPPHRLVWDAVLPSLTTILG